MAEPADGGHCDPALVVIDHPRGASFDDWLLDLSGDEPSAVDAAAAELLRDLRRHGDR